MTSSLPTSVRTFDFDGDPAPSRKVNATEVDAQLDLLHARINQVKSILDGLLRSDDSVQDGYMRSRMLHPEVLTAFNLQNSWQIKVPCRLASPVNVNIASPGVKIDGVAVASGDRVILPNQTIQSQNGIYIWNGAATPMTRATDADTASELARAYCVVTAGNTLVETGWQVQNATIVALGTDAIVVSRVTTRNAALPRVKDTRPALIRSHFGEYRGVWVQDGEAGGELTFTVSAPAAQGATSLSLASTTGLMTGQLCVYKGTDGQYRSIELTSVAANSVSFAPPGLAVAVAAGVNFGNYYVNFAHPSEWGYRSLVDYAIREMRGEYAKATKVVFAIRGYNDVQRLMALVGGTLANATSIIPNQPGGGVNNGVQVNTAANGDGCYFTFLPASSAAHILSMNVNPGGTGNMVITVTASDGTVLATKTITANGNHTQVETLTFKPIDGDHTRVAFAKTAANFFIFANLTIAELGDTSIADFDHGTHILYGDSWAEQLYGWGSAQTALPNATFINAGVGGETSDQILARFDSGVLPYAPDFVWVFAGTNDYFQSYTAAQYRSYMAQIVAKIQAVGAKAIVFEPSVGVKTYSGFADKELTSRSRDYNQVLNALPMVTGPDSFESTFGVGSGKVLTISIPATTLAAGGYEDHIVALVGAAKSVELLHSFGIGLTASLWVKVGFTTAIGGAIADGVTITSNSEVNTIRTYTNTSGANRFVVIRRENITGAPAQFGGIFLIRVRK